MNHKVLLADDSLTIQKVIRITLANQPYDIVDCSSEEELFRKLPNANPKIVFLDFNLSDKYTGYELSKKIKEICPTTQVLLLLGTFDTVDEELLSKNGISEKIVKPFDSNKFIAICKRLTEMDEEFDVQYPETKETEEVGDSFETSEEDNWTVTRSAEIEKTSSPVEDAEVTHEELNALHKQMTDWGINVPDMIGSPTPASMSDIPPVIDEEEFFEETITSTDQIMEAKPAQKEKEEHKLPSSSDLEWPTMDGQVDRFDSPTAGPSSKLISTDSFNMNDQSTDEQWSMNKLYGHEEPETDVKSIEDQIRDELENDLWAVDEFETKPKLKVVKDKEEERHVYQPQGHEFDENLFAPLDNQTTPWHEAKPLDHSQIINDLRPVIEESVKKAVKEYLDQYLKQSVEKVTWEVIPDLAENLIRQELNKISKQILGE